MNEISQRTMAPRVDYIRYIYETADDLFETFGQPIAVYEPDGKIVLATKKYRELAEITEDDIKKGSVNIFDCLNDENAGMIEAARAAFGNSEKIVKDIVCPLHTKNEHIKFLLANYKNAIFFPICWLNFKRTEVDCCAVLLIQEPGEGADDESG